MKGNNNFPNAKSFFLIFFLLLLMLSSIATIFLFQELKSQKLLLKLKERQNVEMLRRIANDDVKSIVSDLFLLLAHPALHQMIENDNPATRHKLSTVFKEFCKTTKFYDQVRFLDETGMERIRINSVQGNPYIVTDDKLQDKSKRYYFNDTFKLEPGRVFISPFDLNIEQGQIEYPLKPMIRFGTPVVNHKGHRRGIVLLNYFGAILIHTLNQSSSDSVGSFMLLNRDGYWLKGLKPEDEWGFMYKDRKNLTLAQRYPKYWEIVSAQDEGQLSNDQGICTFATIWPLGRNMQSSTGAPEAFKMSDSDLSKKDFYWKIVSLVTKETLNKHRTTILFNLLPFYLFAVLLITLVSWGLSMASKHRKQAVQERLQREKLQGVLEMAGTICHEFNQPLMSISGYMELLLMDIPEDKSEYANIRKIREQVDRLGKITRKLMNITKYKTKSYLKGSIIDIDEASAKRSDE